ncbi:hypothetical protein, partial [Chitinimonas sp.]|uniref:hypothetical protein n=1 Tax=Chitinimonas sp. TaxID=1934313 RepID=UPI0035B3AC80
MAMLKYLGLERPFLLLARKLLFTAVRSQLLSESPQALGIDPARPVCYVLQRRLLSNILVLEREVLAAGLPSPLEGLSAEGVREDRAFFFTTRAERWFGRSATAGNSPRMERMVQAVRGRPDFDAQLVPVTILWGRTPDRSDKESSIWKLLFSESWAPRGGLRQLFTILVHGRQTLVRFEKPLSLKELVSDAEDQERAVR